MKNDYISIKLDQFEHVDSWWLSVHNSEDIPSSYDWGSVQISTKFWYAFEFTVNSYNLLKSPYPTNCLNYTETEYLSRNDCIRKCKINRSVDNCGVVSFQMDVYRNEPNVTFAETEDQINCVKNLSLKKSCRKACPKYDCFKQHFLTKIASHRNNTLYDSTINLAFSKDPQIVLHHKPKLESIEFMCFLGSTLSLWFGLAQNYAVLFLTLLFARILH